MTPVHARICQRRRPQLPHRSAHIGIALAAVVVAATGVAGEPTPKPVEIVIVGAPDRGVFDPSIAGDGRQLYMTFSGVGSTGRLRDLNHNAVQTFLARSVDEGRTWRLVGGAVNPTVDAGAGATPSRGDRRWQSEVSTLAFDPYAPPRARWTLFWHQYLNADGARRFEHGWIAYKQAETAEGLAAATPIKLMAARGYSRIDDDPSATTRPPIAGPPILRLNDLHHDLATCLVASEPSALARPDGLYLAFACFRASAAGLGGVKTDIAMLKCARPCEATKPGAWSYVATVLSQRDAETLGLRKFSATDLFHADGRDFVMVSPVGINPGPDAYKGCVAFPFADIARGAVVRRGDGAPEASAAVALQKDSFNGACDLLPVGPLRGLLIGRIDFSAREGVIQAMFRIYASGVMPDVKTAP